MENLLLSLMFLLSTFYVGAIIFMVLGWNRLRSYGLRTEHPATTVSILIAARNEEEKLENTILDILAQDYPSELMELIIVDDHSTDNTPHIVLKYSSRGVKLIRMNEVEQYNSYKKRAIAKAIQHSASELIVTTDADCRMGIDWLKTVVSLYESGDYKMISSPVMYFEEKNSFEEMQTLEFLFLIGLGASAIGNKYAATCNGANLAYSRQVFLELKGFDGIDHLASGDDELLLHKVAAAYPEKIAFCRSKEAIVFTHAKPTLKEFIKQRKRWASKSTRYKNKWLVLLGVAVWLFNVITLLSLVSALWNPDLWKIALVGLIPKMIVEFIFLVQVSRFAGRTSLLWYQPILSIMHMFYLVFIGIAGNSGKYEWKGRTVN